MSSAFKRYLIRQFSKPSGPLGYLAGAIMERRESNRERNRATVDALDIKAEDRVLEIGSGPGLALDLVAGRLGSGHVVGIDHSPVMVRQARTRLARHIQAGRVELRCCSLSELTDSDERFDKIYLVNVFMFFDDPDATLDQVHGLLAGGGKLSITHQPRKPGATRADTESYAAQLEQRLQAAGFDEVTRRIIPVEPVVAVMCTGTKRETLE